MNRLHLTPNMLAAAYELVRTLPPFSKWDLPEAEEVEFHVAAFRDRHGDYRERPHTIRVSQHATSHLNTVVQIVAHEALHLAQEIMGMNTAGVQHNAHFRAMWVRVARTYGWDEKAYLL